MEQPKLEAILRLIKMLINNTSLRIPQIADRLSIAPRKKMSILFIAQRVGRKDHHRHQSYCFFAPLGDKA